MVLYIYEGLHIHGFSLSSKNKLISQNVLKYLERFKLSHKTVLATVPGSGWDHCYLVYGGLISSMNSQPVYEIRVFGPSASGMTMTDRQSRNIWNKHIWDKVLCCQSNLLSFLTPQALSSVSFSFKCRIPVYP